MAKPELGEKRLCPSCGAKYYDLNRDPITCPKCNAVFELAETEKAKPEKEAEAGAAEADEDDDDLDKSTRIDMASDDDEEGNDFASQHYRWIFYNGDAREEI